MLVKGATDDKVTAKMTLRVDEWIYNFDGSNEIKTVQVGKP